MLGNAKELLTGSPTLPIRVSDRLRYVVRCTSNAATTVMIDCCVSSLKEVVAWPRMRRRPPQKELYFPRPTLGELYYGAYQRNSDHEILSSPFEERTAKALSGTL